MIIAITIISDDTDIGSNSPYRCSITLSSNTVSFASVRIMYNNMLNNMLKWCEDTCNSGKAAWNHRYSIWCFSSKEDMTMFILTWDGTEI